LIDQAKRATALVWNHHVGEKTTMRLVFSNKIKGHGVVDPKTGKEVEVVGIYYPETDSIGFALDVMQGKNGLIPVHLMAIIGGHETMHRVQFHKGDPPTSSAELFANGQYYEDRHEIEAHTAGAHVFRAEYPFFTGYVFSGRPNVEIPAVSIFPSLFQDVDRGKSSLWEKPHAICSNDPEVPKNIFDFSIKVRNFKKTF